MGVRLRQAQTSLRHESRRPIILLAARPHAIHNGRGATPANKGNSWVRGGGAAQIWGVRALIQLSPGPTTYY